MKTILKISVGILALLLGMALGAVVEERAQGAILPCKTFWLDDY